MWASAPAAVSSAQGPIFGLLAACLLILLAGALVRVIASAVSGRSAGSDDD